MDEFDKLKAADEFIKNMDTSLYEIKRIYSFMDIHSEKEKKALDEALSILDKKISKLKKCKSLDDVKKHLKVKKLAKNFTIDN